MTLRYDNYDTLQTQYCTIDDELMRRTCWVGPLTEREIHRRAQVDGIRASRFIAKKLFTLAATEGFVKGDRVRVGDHILELE